MDFHEKSFLHLPPTTNEGSFNTYLSGVNEDNLKNSFIEQLLEQYRYFAEECDFLSSITFTVDTNSGYGGLLSRILDEVQQDSPTAVKTIFSCATNAQHMSTTSMSSKLTKKDKLFNLNLPFCYSRWLEHSPIILPIDTDNISHLYHFHTDKTRPLIFKESAVVASVIEALFSPVYYGYKSDYEIAPSQQISQSGPPSHSQQSASRAHEEESYSEPSDTDTATMHKWYRSLSVQGRLPFAALECSIPSPLRLFSSSGHTSILDQFTNEYFGSAISDSRADRRTSSVVAVGQLNPFTLSLSNHMLGLPMDHLRDQQRRALSNLIVFRGASYCPGLSNRLFEKCLGTNYSVSGCYQCTEPIFSPLHFPSISPRAGSREHSGADLSACVSAGADQSMGVYIKHAADQLYAVGFKSSSRSGGVAVFDDERVDTGSTSGSGSGRIASTQGSILSQLERAGIERDEGMRMMESLLECSQRYES